jgi:hypothetical protein
MRSRKGVRRKRLVDLSTPVLSSKEVEWFVKLQCKHRKGQSTDWAAMLNEWNATLVQLSLDPNLRHLCQGIMPKSMGQSERFEKVAFDAINTCNSLASAAAHQSLQSSRSNLLSSVIFPSQIASSQTHSATSTTLSIPSAAAAAHFQAAPSTQLPHVPQQQSQTQQLRPTPKGPNRGGLNTPHRCVKCTEASGQVVYKKDHKCPFNVSNLPLP